MIKTRSVVLFIALTSLMNAVVSAQGLGGREPAPLKNWAAPLYWQPTEAAADITEAGSTGLRFRANSAAAATTQPAGTNALVFVAMTPCRVVDTRAGSAFTGAFGPPRLAGEVARTFPFQSSATCTIPARAQAYSLNITVVPPAALGFVTVYPSGQSLPLAATLNALQGQVVANAAIVPAGTNGSVDVYASNNTELVLDINGFYTGEMSLAAGTAAAPTLTFSGDSTSGLYSSGTGTVNVAAGGMNRLTVTHTGVGIGVTPRYPLDVAGDINLSGSIRVANEPVLRLTAFGTALGYGALENNTLFTNTAVGTQALRFNSSGGLNTALGGGALGYNRTGGYNTAVGSQALFGVTTGNENTAVGANAGGGAITGGGYTTGTKNVAIGSGAAYKVNGAGSNNIHISNDGTSTDDGTIRIGAPGTHRSFFAAGIRGTTTVLPNAIPVVIDSAGQLGTISSSRRFKEDIADMGETSNGLLRLRPVTYRYKQPYADGSKPLDYGLIAEEVAEVYPDLVVKSADGQFETVQYQKLAPMLLNEMQRQQRTIDQQRQDIDALKSELNSLKEIENRRGTVEPSAADHR